MCATNTPMVIMPRMPSSAGQRADVGRTAESATTASCGVASDATRASVDCDIDMIGPQSGKQALVDQRVAGLEVAGETFGIEQRLREPLREQAGAKPGQPLRRGRQRQRECLVIRKG